MDLAPGETKWQADVLGLGRGVSGQQMSRSSMVSVDSPLQMGAEVLDDQQAASAGRAAWDEG